MATANFYHIPFDKTLDIIKQAGFEYIELDGYWKGGDSWETAQHIKDIKPKDVINMVSDSGLRIASFHDMGGVIEQGSESLINSKTYEYLALTEIPCVIFHTPCHKTTDKNWWKKYKKTVINDLKTLSENRIICIENMIQFNNYVVPLLEPKEMFEFISEANVFTTIDTTHYAQSATNIVYAADILKDKVKTIHLSDYYNGKSHIYIGDGELEFKSFYNKLNIDDLYLTTIECALPYSSDNVQLAIDKSKEAFDIVEKFTSNQTK